MISQQAAGFSLKQLQRAGTSAVDSDVSRSHATKEQNVLQELEMLALQHAMTSLTNLIDEMQFLLSVEVWVLTRDVGLILSGKGFSFFKMFKIFLTSTVLS